MVEKNLSNKKKIWLGGLGETHQICVEWNLITWFPKWWAQNQPNKVFVSSLIPYPVTPSNQTHPKQPCLIQIPKNPTQKTEPEKLWPGKQSLLITLIKLCIPYPKFLDPPLHTHQPDLSNNTRSDRLIMSGQSNPRASTFSAAEVVDLFIYFYFYFSSY